MHIVKIQNIENNKLIIYITTNPQKTKEYKLLRQTARAGIDSARRFQVKLIMNTHILYLLSLHSATT